MTPQQPSRHLRLGPNPRGRDIIVGDIHGHFSRVRRELGRIGFDPRADRLICVGDLVDRGPEGPLAAHWLAEPWFYSVMGNHDAAILHRAGLLGIKFELFMDHHAWFDALPDETRQHLCEQLAALPWALEIETPHGLVGVVHAEVPQRYADWTRFVAELEAEDVRSRATSGRRIARLAHDLDHPATDDDWHLPGVSWVVHGHTPRPGCLPGRLGNRLYIDTMGWYDQPVSRGTPAFTLIDAAQPLIPL